ncbi:MAG: Y-family DNA polymerase [Planctomycetia bacterium]|nr:Y-family DNA polymerase [Planctomycetia bacterium]
MTTKIIGLIDCDCFFASCEKVFRPDWKNRAVVVLSNNDGCVVARSPEAKRLGIPMGEAYFKLKDFARRYKVIVRSANYSLYGDLSSRVVQTLEQWSPQIDVYSIDESFIDLTGRFCDADARLHGQTPDAETLAHDFYKNRRRYDLAWPECPWLGEIPQQTARELEELAQEIVKTIPKWTGIPVSLGLGPTRTLAKAASRLAKDRGHYQGQKYVMLFDREERLTALKELPIDKVWGVGRRLLATFQKSGIKTAYDLAKLDTEFVRKSFTVVQERLVRELRGELMYDAVAAPVPQHTMQISRSFGKTLASLEELERPVATFAARAAAKLRARNLLASGLFVYVTTNRFNTNAPQYHGAMACNFPIATNSSPEIINAAMKLLHKIYQDGYEYKRAGVIAMDLSDKNVAQRQQFLFDPDPTRPEQIRKRDNSISQLVDQLNSKFGQGAVFFGTQGVNPMWTPNSNFISPSYTTDWDALPCVQ